MNRILISIIGPTSIGKTNLTIKLAKYYKTEILSCDSKQFYKELKIGTSRPTQKQLKTIKHHFIGNLNVKQDYNIYKFYKDINKKLKKLFKKYNILFMVGGSCLYETTIIEGINYIPKINKKKINNYRNKLNKINIKLLLKELKKKDNFFFNFILKNKKDKRKIIRALEVLHFTKKKFSFFLKKKKTKKQFKKYIRIGLKYNNIKLLYNNINKNVDLIIKKGLFKEALKLYKKYYKFNLNSLNTIGYKEIFEYLKIKKKNKKIKFINYINKIKKNTRNYAKRQITWYRKKTDIYWFKPNDYKKIIYLINKKINE